MTITLFRLDHRKVRDQRITTHVALTARAMGCDHFIYSGERDRNMEESITDVSSRWGGDYEVQYSDRKKSRIKEFSGTKVHLTMYGEKHTKTITTLQETNWYDLLIIVGGPKVSSYVFSLVDFNTAIGWQPHSEVTATAIFLHELMGDKKLYKSYDDAKIQVDGTGYKAQRSERFS